MPTTKLRKMAANLEKVPAKGAAKAAKLVKDLAEDEARRATGDGRMSGYGRRGPKLRAVASTKARGHTATATVKGVPAGAWTILESGARPHAMKPRAGRVLGGSLRHPVSGPIRHPGSRARRTWRRVVERARREVPEVFADEVARAVR